MLRPWFRQFLSEGYELAQEGAYDELLDLLEEAGREDLTGEERTYLDNNRAWSLLEVGRATEALELIESVLERVPREAPSLTESARGTFGVALAVAGYLEDGLEVLDELLRKRAGNPWIVSARHFYRGYVLYELGRREEAREAWRRTYEVDPVGLYGTRARARLQMLDEGGPPYR